MSYIRELYLRLCMSSVFRAVISKPLFSSFAAYAKAKGESLTQAAVSAKNYIAQAIISGAAYEIGHGHGPVNHFFR